MRLSNEKVRLSGKKVIPSHNKAKDLTIGIGSGSLLSETSIKKLLLFKAADTP